MTTQVKFKGILIKFYWIVISLTLKIANIFKLHPSYSNITILFFSKTNKTYVKSKQMIKRKEGNKTLPPIYKVTQVPNKIRMKNQTKYHKFKKSSWYFWRERTKLQMKLKKKYDKNLNMFQLEMMVH